jgi:hypothetical protein
MDPHPIPDGIVGLLIRNSCGIHTAVFEKMSMSWNYRIIKSEAPGGAAVYAMHEVHYEGGVADSWNAEPAQLVSEDIGGLHWIVSAFTQGLHKPVLHVIDGKLHTLDANEHGSTT